MRSASAVSGLQELQSAPASEWLRESLYAGALVKLAPGSASRHLVAEVWRLLEALFGPAPRDAWQHLPPAEHLERVGEARRLLKAPRYLEAVRDVWREVGLEPGELALDVPRLRAMLHRGHEVPAAAPAYYAHRDTWYANPQCQLNAWVPLHDVSEEETFTFFPEAFHQPVPNTSAGFDYEEWMRKAGWQNPNRTVDAVYPTVQHSTEALRPQGFGCRQGEVLLFSAAHLHQPRAHAAGRTRFSVDFRAVHLEDYRLGRGAPNVDNHSRGSTLGDYAHPPAPASV